MHLDLAIRSNLICRIDHRIDLEIPRITSPKVYPGIDLGIKRESRGRSGAKSTVGSGCERIGDVRDGRIDVAPPRHLIKRHDRVHSTAGPRCHVAPVHPHHRWREEELIGGVFWWMID